MARASKSSLKMILNPHDPLPSARKFLRETKSTLIHQEGTFFAYDGSAYRELKISEIRAKLYAFLEKMFRKAVNQLTGKSKVKDFQPTRAKVDNVVDALRAEVELPASTQAPAWLRDDPGLDPLEMLSVSNGILHIPTRKLLKPTPNFFTLSALPFKYHRRPPKPKNWLKFLDSVWPDDAQATDLLQEWNGHLLTPSTRFQKMLMSIGPPRGGKGLSTRVTKQLVGPENYISTSMGSFSQPNGLQCLIGKSVCLISDARIKRRTDDLAERLLSISGEDAPAVSRKYLPAWTGTLTTRFWIVTNELPQIEDASGALNSRFLLLPYPISHLDEEDLELEDRFVAELPAILNWALDGYDRLYERGHFVQPSSANDLIETFEELSSPIRACFKQDYVFGPGKVTHDGMWEMWGSWCEATRNNPGTRATFGRDSRAAFPEIGQLRGGSDGNRVYFYTGIRKRPRSRIALQPGMNTSSAER